MLIIFAGLPGVGKSEIARELARQLGAVYLRIDSIEQALRNSGLATGSLDDSGYRIAYALAEENIRLGRVVVADSVNPLPITRDAWRNVAKRAAVRAVEVEVLCSIRRVEARSVDLPGLIPPSWDEVMSREYHPWDRERIVVDTAITSVSNSVTQIRQALQRTSD
jgi:predicted kinase